MKKISLIFCTIFALFYSVTTVNANEIQPFYITDSGVELTEEQYNNLLGGCTIEELNSMEPTIIEKYKDSDSFRSTSSSKYIKTLTTYRDGVLYDTVDVEITADEYNNAPDTAIVDEFNIAQPRFGTTVTHETNYKYITLTVQGDVSVKTASLKTEWKTIPTTKSYDIFAIATGSGSAVIKTEPGYRYGYQISDSITHTYEADDPNWKVFNTNAAFKKGMTLSQNIIDSTTTRLVQYMQVDFLSGADPFVIKATHQHAQYTVSLADSKDIYLQSGGMGGIIKFNSSSVANKYDNTAGLEATWTAWG